MEKYVVMIKSNAAPGRDADYEDWYNNIHLDEILRLPGFVSGRQFRVRNENGVEHSAFSHVALFEIESEDVDATLGNLRSTFTSGAMTLTDALDVTKASERSIFQATGAVQYCK